MKKHKITKTNNDFRVLLLRRLPSGFGSVRYLGKGRCCPYAVHPPESPAKPFQTGNRRPPAICYVRSRETGIKILVIYHAGLYKPGLENDSIRLNQLYKKVLEQGDGKETGTNGNIPWKNASGFMMYEDSPVNLNDLSLQNTYAGDLPENGDVLIKSERMPAGNPSGIPADSNRPPDVNSGILPDENPTMPLAVRLDTPTITKQVLRNAEMDVSSDGDSRMISEGGHPESMEVLYYRLNSLQTDIRNLMQDIERMKMQLEGGMNGNHFAGLASQPILSQPVGQPIVPQSIGQPISSISARQPVLSQPIGQPISSQATRQPVLSQPIGQPISPQSAGHPISSHSAVQPLSFQPANSPILPHTEPSHYIDQPPTLSAVYEAFHQFKYGPQAAKQLSVSSRNATAAAYRKLSCFYDLSLDEISVMEWQKLVNETAAAGHSRAAVTDLVTLIRQLYRFAYPRDMCTREHGKYVVMPYTSEEMHHQDFTDAELKILWENRNDSVVRMLLIMCYSGFRIGEFETLQVVLDQDGRTGYFCGGIKTKAGKNRIVPVHSAIMPLLRQILDSDGQPVFFCGRSTRRFREYMKQTLIRLGIDAAPDKESDRVLAGKTGPDPKKDVPVPESNRGSPGINETVPESNRGSPGINEIAPESNRGAPGINETAPESSRGSPGISETAPESNRGSPGINEITPQNNRAAPEKAGVSPSKPGGSPAINKPIANSPPASGAYRAPYDESRYHTPHSCRHTFSRLCESYGVSEADRKRMLGHSFGNDITNGVYGHRSVEELRTEIEKIKVLEI